MPGRPLRGGGVPTNVFHMELHETLLVNAYEVTRVPGGWLYRPSGTPSVPATFVPNPMRQ